MISLVASAPTSLSGESRPPVPSPSGTAGEPSRLLLKTAASPLEVRPPNVSLKTTVLPSAERPVATEDTCQLKSRSCDSPGAWHERPIWIVFRETRTLPSLAMSWSTSQSGACWIDRSSPVSDTACNEGADQSTVVCAGRRASRFASP